MVRLGILLSGLRRPSVTCPYCGRALSIEPEKKQKCPECGKEMYAKAGPGEKHKRFVTKEQAEQIDARLKEQRKRTRIAQLQKQIKETHDKVESLKIAQISRGDGESDKAWDSISKPTSKPSKRSASAIECCGN